MTKVDDFKCPLCKCEKGSHVFSAFDFDQSADPFDVMQCTMCGVAQTFPVPDSSSLGNYYSKSYYGSSTKKFSAIIEYLTILGSHYRARKMFKALSNSNLGNKKFKVLDIGCGRARLLRQLSQLGCDCTGTELEKHPMEDIEPGTNVHFGSLEDAKFKDSAFDGVIIWHVLEHLYSPGDTLSEISRVTRNGGILALAVPNFSSFQARFFKSNWFHLDIPRHLYHFNVNDLSRALVQRGYVIDSVSTCSPEQNLFGFIQSLMSSLKFLGKPNSYYQLLKQHSGITKSLKLIAWTLLAVLIFPIAVIEFVITCLLKKGASLIIFAHKSQQQLNMDD